MEQKSQNEQSSQAQNASATFTADMRPRSIRLPARPAPVARATPKDQKEGGVDRSVDLFTGAMLDDHGKQCAAAIEGILSAEVGRLNAICGIFAGKLQSLGVNPSDVIQEAVDAQKAAKI